jgi:hypothetical protein
MRSRPIKTARLAEEIREAAGDLVNRISGERSTT